MALRQNPGDEITRVVYEELMRENLPADAERRTALAEHHFDRASQLEERNRVDRALQEYRRGLQLAPYHRNGRLGYAELLRLRGYEARYLQELKVLRNNGHDDSYITDRIETFESVLQDSVASRWGVDQFTLDRARVGIALYYHREQNGVSHEKATPHLAAFLADALLEHERISIVESTPREVGSFAEAYRHARNNDAELFLIARFSEASDSFRIGATLYSGRSGSELQSLESVRLGNGRLRNAANAVSDTLARALPLRGSLVERDGDRGLVDVGRVHGLEAEDRLSVLRDGPLLLESDRLRYMVGEADVLGTFTVSGLDDLVAEGTLEGKSLYDLIHAGNIVLRRSEDAAESGNAAEGEGGPAPENEAAGETGAASRMFPPIYHEIRGIR
jgi:hypothetical protein